MESKILKVVITSEDILKYPNDAELGKAVRAVYHNLLKLNKHSKNEKDERKNSTNERIDD